MGRKTQKPGFLLRAGGSALLAGTFLFFFSSPAWRVSPRHLSFEDRVRAQEAIERVYYSHQIGATEPFENAVPRQVLEDKVRRYLKQSVALEQLWNTPITAEILRRETERMAQGTRLPGRLTELYAALGHDPFLIEECLARATLADRLSRNFFANDPVIHAEAREQAEALHRELTNGGISLQTVRAGQQVMGATVDEMVLVKEQDAGGSRPQAPARRDGVRGRREELSPEEFRRQRARFPERVGTISPITQESDHFTIRAVLTETENEAEVVVFSVAKTTWDEWWDQMAVEMDSDAVAPVSTGGESAPSSRTPSSAKRDAQNGASLQGAGSAFTESCTGDLWDNGILDNVPPEARYRQTAVWTGNVMVVWGGWGGSTLGYRNTGGRYDPALDTWTPISTAGAPVGRYEHTGVWTGEEMIVWGGYNPYYGDPNDPEYTAMMDTGGRYDPAADTWTPTSTTGAPSARAVHTAVWTGSLMVVWGGYGDNSRVDTGARYDPVTDTWTPTSTTGAPAARAVHTAVWTGNLMVVWGGTDELYTSGFNTGGQYDPVTDTWTPTSTTGAPSGRYDHAAEWTGSLMVVWGGNDGGSPLNTGGRYDPGADTWTPTSITGAPTGRHDYTAVWTGNLMVVWGGDDGGSPLNTGGNYDPVTDTWTPTSTTGAPSARSYHTAVWTGSLMVVWGGDGGPPLNTGGRYDPATDTWTPTSTTGAPSRRWAHTAVWTGNLMVVWGGTADGGTDTGGRYDPATDTWTPTSTTDAPSGRYWHTAVWTGSLMVIWGGRDGAHTDTGGRYDPGTDTWTPTSTTGAPSARSYHTAVWTGNLMVVWGGTDELYTSGLNTGGRYDPVTDTWTPTSTTDAPSGRYWHTALWSGSRMVVWGGSDGYNSYLSTGGRYEPAADTWTSTSTAGAPSARWAHSVVWTGNLMVVWGGAAGGRRDTGGRYDPAADTWTPTSTTGVPSARSAHTAVWTGSLMVVWGGSYGSSTDVNTGGRYDPVTDTWTPTSTTDAPSGRTRPTAVWTGRLMIVWGGNGVYLNDGGRYIPDVSVDYDSDGYAVCHGDCNDSHAAIYPDAPEVCDGIDNQCPGDTGHGLIDEGFPDSDIDDVADCVDNCVAIFNPDQLDGDADGAGDDCDCAPGDATAFTIPHDIRNVRFTDAVTIQWDSEAPFSGMGTVYDLLRGKVSELPVGEGASEECLEHNLSAHHYVEDYVPPLSEIRFYLIRGENTCGPGTYGSSESGERVSTTCP